MRKAFQSFIEKYNKYYLEAMFGPYTVLLGVQNISQSKFIYLNVILICIGIILIIYPRSSRNRKDKPK